MRSGQALVLVMMVLSVALTVGLSIATRSTNEVKVSSAAEESARALEAAEAGLEKALGGTSQGTQVNLPGSNSTYVMLPTPTLPTNLDEWIIPFQLIEGQTATIDMRNYGKPPGTEHSKIRFCWGTSGSTPITKLQVDVYYLTGSGQVKIGKDYYDPAVGGFNTNLSQCPNGMNPKYTNRVDFNSFGITNIDAVQVLMLRLKVFGNGANAEPVAVRSPGGDFDRQGYEYTSVGSAGTSTQKIRGVELNYDLPMMFDNAVFSGTSISK